MHVAKLFKTVEVAVKTLIEGKNVMSKEEFLKEAKIMHKLSHPKIVQLLGTICGDIFTTHITLFEI